MVVLITEWVRELGKELSSVIQEQLLVFHADLRAGGLPQGSSAEFPLTAVTIKYHREMGHGIVDSNPSMMINGRSENSVPTILECLLDRRSRL